ncbi:MAG: helix-turn-helix transcriptional regulator [Muribaculaceae bacterium]|nr:helix-turn-helix transcriptional regulator [Muribaculaceae bacterium]
MIKFYCLTLQTNKLLIVNQMSAIEESPIIQRLRQYMQEKGLSTTQFADKAGIPRPTFSQLMCGRNKTINNQMLAKIDEGFPDLDIVWLLFGRGDMRQLSNFETSEAQNSVYKHDKEPQDVEKHLFNSAIDTRETSRDSNISNDNSKGLFDLPFNSDGFVAVPGALKNDKDSNREKKRIKSIIVFYTDNSFQAFEPES